MLTPASTGPPKWILGVGTVVDREISVSCVVAYLLWALSLAMWAAAWKLGPEMRALAVMVCIAAATGTVRTYFISLGHRIKAAMAVTAVVENSSVRSLR